VSQQIIDDVDVAVLSGPHKSVVQIYIHIDEHALHIRQSTMGSVITKCLQVKVERHLQSSTFLMRSSTAATKRRDQHCWMLDRQHVSATLCCDRQGRARSPTQCA